MFQKYEKLFTTKSNLQARVEAEYGATEGKLKSAKKAKELGLDAIHNTVHEMCKDKARHGKAFLGLLERHFGNKSLDKHINYRYKKYKLVYCRHNDAKYLQLNLE